MGFVVGDLATLTNTFTVDGVATDPTTVTLLTVAPDGTETTYTYAGSTITRTETGAYSCDVALSLAGRWVGVWTGTGAVVDVQTVTWAVAATYGAVPDLEAVKAYLGDVSHSDAEILDALAAEVAAQSRRCRIPSAYPDDLAQALKRRVARNLAARAVPVASFTSFEGGGTSSRVPKLDAEIARFEGPFRRRKVG